MTTEPERNLLHYRLVEKIGEGGMGVVWKAVDTTLDREVAIKILPDLFAGDADRLARFEREAKLLASLSHPNIAGIYGIHETGAGADPAIAPTRFIAMELIDGEDLSERLSRGTLSRHETLKVALQIAEAFEAAHDSGVIHRDLKPANVKLTPDNQVKVLDFGLAKALSGDATNADASASMSPTMTSTGTVAGVILGTASYMSPEQAKGKAVDRRADIWSFGVVLFEMFTGRRLFHGETISETLAAVIMKDIDWGALPSDTPKAIRRLLERCLERDPRSRMRDIGDARIAVEEALRSPEPVETELAAAPAQSTWLTRLPWAVAALAVAALAWAILAPDPVPESAPVMRFTMTTPEDQSITLSPVPPIAISPDGRRIAYVSTSNGEELLFLRHVHQQEAQPLKGTNDASAPFFSPDGEWIGFGSGGKLKKVSILGGPPSTLCDAPRLRGASWGSDGTIVFSPDRSGGVMRVPDAGGTPEWLSIPDSPDSLGAPSERWPDLLPDNRTVLVTSTSNNSDYSEAEIVALSLEDGSRKVLVKGGTYARFVPPGFLIYSRENAIFATRFDPVQLEVSGPAVPVLENVRGASNYGSRHLVFSDTGTLLYLEGVTDFASEELVWLDRDGTTTRASAHERDIGWASISPDAEYVALEVFAAGEEQSDVWILELERDTLTRLTFHEHWDMDPVWSPDGEWLVFSSIRDGNAPNLFRKRADGTGETERLTTSPFRQTSVSWSPDGQFFAFMEFGDKTSADIMIYRPGADPEVETFLATPYNDWGPRISHDGRWLAYASDLTDSAEVYVRPMSGGGQQVKVSTDGGFVPQWDPNGEALLYRTRTGEMMRVAFSVDGGRFRPALPEKMFDYDSPPLSFMFQISPDGERILAYRDLGAGSAIRREPTVVINWIDELEAKVPAAK